MLISVKFALNECGSTCGNVLDLFFLETSNTDQNFSTNISNFPSNPNAVLTSNVRDGQTLFTEIRRIGTPTHGIFVGFRDRGACVSIAEVIVYYAICDAHSPLVGANFTRDGQPGETLSGTCFPNMAVNMDMPGGSFDATCVLNVDLTAAWNTECMCVPGYRFNTSSRWCEGA